MTYSTAGSWSGPSATALCSMGRTGIRMQVIQPTGRQHHDATWCTRRVEETFLSALATSRFRTRFLLHGAWALASEFGGPPRPTRGVDLIDMERTPEEGIVSALQEIVGASSVGREADWYRMRIRSRAERRSLLRRVAVPVRSERRWFDLAIDITEARDPAPQMRFQSLYPALGSGCPGRIAICTLEELVAEKAALLVTYGGDHTRLKDILDLWLLAGRIGFDRQTMIPVLAAVFEGRDAERMLQRDDGYWERAFDPDRVMSIHEERWSMLVGSLRSHARPATMRTTLAQVGRFLIPVLLDLKDGRQSSMKWDGQDGWSTVQPPCGSSTRLQGIWRDQVLRKAQQ